MNALSQNEENDLVAATQRAIRLTKGEHGMDANKAIEKVAREMDYNPSFIERMTQSFNKAKSYHMMKEASPDTRGNSFSLAKSDDIISKIFRPEVEKVASQEVNLPGNLVEQILNPPMEKVASEDVPDYDVHAVNALQPASFLKQYEQHRDFADTMVKIAKQEVAQHKHNMLQSFEKAADHMGRLQPSELEKIARCVVNSYGEYIGNRLLHVVNTRIPNNIPQMTKTASAAIFPKHQPYGNIQDANDAAHKMADAECWVRHLTKEASLASAFLANAAANVVTDGRGDDRDPSKKPDDFLNAEHYNKIKGLDAKRSLYSMINSEDFAPYKHAEVVKAWNRLSAEHPKILNNNPAAARQLMLQNLEGGSNRDMYEIEQIQKVDKGSETEQ